MLLNEMELDMDQIAENLNAFEKFLDTLPEKALGLGVRVLFAAVLFLVGSKLIKFIRRITKKSLQRANVETGIIQFLDGLIKACLYGLLVLMIAGNFGFDATSVVALVGSAGVTVGLALQGSLSNLAGGVLILLLKPFRVGDFIMESGHGTEGTVKEIGIFYTKLTTTDGKVVVLPNGGLANSSITNATAVPSRLLMTVGVNSLSYMPYLRIVLSRWSICVKLQRSAAKTAAPAMRMPQMRLRHFPAPFSSRSTTDSARISRTNPIRTSTVRLSSVY